MDEPYKLTDEDVAIFQAWGDEPPPPLPPSERGDLIFYDKIKVEHVDWIIPGLVPAGMLTVVAGQQGLGKSLLHEAWAADLSKQGKKTILVSGEDSPTHTTKARLLALEADTTKIAHAAITPVLGNGQDPEWLARILEWIETTEAALIVLDPLSAFIDAHADSYKDTHIRGILAPLDVIARRTGCAIVYVMHLTKGTGVDPMQRVQGSVAFTAAARSVVLVTPQTDPRDPHRIVAHVKCNVAELAVPQLWEVEPILIPNLEGRDVKTARIVFRGLSDVDVYTLLAPRETEHESTERDEAVTIIMDALATGPVLSRDLERMVREAGVSSRTYDTARREVGVKAFQRDRKWFTELVTSQDATAQDATSAVRSDKPAWLRETFSHEPVRTYPLEGVRPDHGDVSQSPMPERGSVEWIAMATPKELDVWKHEVLDGT